MCSKRGCSVLGWKPAEQEQMGDGIILKSFFLCDFFPPEYLLPENLENTQNNF